MHICTIRQRSIFCSSLPREAIITCSNSIQSLWTKNRNMQTFVDLMDFNYPKKGVPIRGSRECRFHRDNDLRQVRCHTVLFHKEAHETLAIAMNHLHGKSNTGEGGEEHGASDHWKRWIEPLFRNQTGCFRTFWCNQPDIWSSAQRDSD